MSMLTTYKTFLQHIEMLQYFVNQNAQVYTTLFFKYSFNLFICYYFIFVYIKE